MAELEPEALDARSPLAPLTPEVLAGGYGELLVAVGP